MNLCLKRHQEAGGLIWFSCKFPCHLSINYGRFLSVAQPFVMVHYWRLFEASRASKRIMLAKSFKTRNWLPGNPGKPGNLWIEKSIRNSFFSNRNPQLFAVIMFLTDNIPSFSCRSLHSCRCWNTVSSSQALFTWNAKSEKIRIIQLMINQNFFLNDQDDEHTLLSSDAGEAVLSSMHNKNVRLEQLRILVFKQILCSHFY